MYEIACAFADTAAQLHKTGFRGSGQHHMAMVADRAEAGWCGGRFSLSGFQLRLFGLALGGPFVLARPGDDLLIHQTVNCIDAVDHL